MQDRTAVLRRELRDLQARIEAVETELKDLVDDRLGRGDPSVSRRQLDRALLRRLKERVASIERALSRATEGTYGLCARCGRQIHPDRLAVLPDARLCIHCAQVGGPEEVSVESGGRAPQRGRSK